MDAKTATRRTERKGSAPGQESVTVNRNNNTTGAKNQAPCAVKGGGDE